MITTAHPDSFRVLVEKHADDEDRLQRKEASVHEISGEHDHPAIVKDEIVCNVAEGIPLTEHAHQGVKATV